MTASIPSSGGSPCGESGLGAPGTAVQNLEPLRRITLRRQNLRISAARGSLALPARKVQKRRDERPRPANPLPERADVDPAVFAAEDRAGLPAGGYARTGPGLAGGAKAANRSDAEVARYIASFDRGAPVEAFLGPAAMQGRYFYAEDLQGFNFERRKGPLAEFRLPAALGRRCRPALLLCRGRPRYRTLPARRRQPDDAVRARDRGARAWIGNRSTVTTHFISDNIAVVVAGRRRFIVPPEQLANLYIGPLDHDGRATPRAWSRSGPIWRRFPRFAEAMVPR